MLPRMLEEILKTRIMVKQSMKAYKHDKAITRMLEARQLGLKFIANFTFGYTAANFSGRMPCTEVRVADKEQKSCGQDMINKVQSDSTVLLLETH